MPKCLLLMLLIFTALNSFFVRGFQFVSFFPKLGQSSQNIRSNSIFVPRILFQMHGRANRHDKNWVSVNGFQSSRESGSNLVSAIENSDYALVNQLLQQGADSNSCDDWGVSCLQKAIKKGRQDIAELLIINGADVHRSDLDSETTSPLHTAARLGDFAIVKLLVQHGADVNRKDAFDCSAYKIALDAKYMSIASFLKPLMTRDEGKIPVDLKSINLGSQQLSTAEADYLLEQNADWEAAERGEESGGGSVVQIVTDPETGAKTIRRIPLKSGFMQQLERRRKESS